MNRKGPWEGYRRQASHSRLPLRAHFHQKRDVWVRGSVKGSTNSARSDASTFFFFCIFVNFGLFVFFLFSYVRSEYGSLWETHQCRPHAYGHTWTPGYELPSGMLHGHAVSTGMGFGAYLSFCEGWTTRGELDRILSLLSNLELSLWHPIMEDVDRLYSAQEKVIEKRGGNLAAPVPKGIGKCGYINHMPHDLLAMRLQEYHEICQGYPRGGLGVEVHCKDVGLEDPATMGLVNQELPGDVNGHENGCHENEKEK